VRRGRPRVRSQTGWSVRGYSLAHAVVLLVGLCHRLLKVGVIAEHLREGMHSIMLESVSFLDKSFKHPRCDCSALRGPESARQIARVRTMSTPRHGH